jgi:hypothetical protein
VLRAADRTAIVERMAKLLEDTGRRIGVRLMTGDVDTLRRSAGKN